MERSLAVFVLGGVLERFPKLTIISAENDVAWMPYLMWRMDMIHSRLGALAGVKLGMKPSEYIKRQVYATFINEPIFIKTLDILRPGQRHVVVRLPTHGRHLATVAGLYQQNLQRSI